MIKTKKYGEVIKFTMGRTIGDKPVYTMACYLVDGLLIDTGPTHVAAEIKEDVDTILSSLHKLLKFPFEKLFCGSGRVIEKNAHASIRVKIKYWESLGKEIRQLHDMGFTPEEIVIKIFRRESRLYAPTEGDVSRINLVRSFLKQHSQGF